MFVVVVVTEVAAAAAAAVVVVVVVVAAAAAVVVVVVVSSNSVEWDFSFLIIHVCSAPSLFALMRFYCREYHRSKPVDVCNLLLCISWCVCCF